MIAYGPHRQPTSVRASAHIQLEHPTFKAAVRRMRGRLQRARKLPEGRRKPSADRGALRLGLQGCLKNGPGNPT